MLTPVFDFFEKLIDQFSWRRLVFSAFLLLSVGICIVAYERYTGAFRLQKIDRVIALAERASSLGATLNQESRRNIDAAIINATGELAEFMSDNTTAFSLDPRVLKGLAAFAPWLSLIIIFPLASPEGTKQAIAGVLAVAVPFAVLGAFLPDSRFAWVNYVLYPVGHFAVLLFAIVALDRRKKA